MKVFEPAPASMRAASESNKRKNLACKVCPSGPTHRGQLNMNNKNERNENKLMKINSMSGMDMPGTPRSIIDGLCF